jgi:ParB-like chromosome segregation protein Spo0J
MTTVTVVVPLTIRHRGGRKSIIAPDGADLGQGEASITAFPTRGDPTLVKALARAHRWRGLLEDGTYATVRDMAKAEKLGETYICRVLRLTLLAPDLVEAILSGSEPDGIKLPALLLGVPVEWDRQNQLG